MASITRREGEKSWRARYRDGDGRMHEKRFTKKSDARDWVREQEGAVKKGQHVAPSRQKITLKQWCEQWLDGYGAAESTRRQASTHLALIKDGLGSHRLIDLRPSHVEKWLRDLERRDYQDSYRYELLGRLRQVLKAAMRDDLLHRNVAEDVRVSVRRRDIRLVTIDQAWALHDAMPEHMRATVMLGAFAGLRVGEVCGLRVEDIDTAEHVVRVRVQYPDERLKSDRSRADLPIPETMALQLAHHVENHARKPYVFVNQWGDQLHPRVVERHFREAREAVRAAEAEAGVDKPVPADFRFHDLRHVYASYLIQAGLNVKVVQERMRHATATLTLDTYADLWPSADDGTRAAVGAAFVGREGPTLRAV